MAISVNINASTVGASIMNAADPSAVSWIRVNANNTITYLSANNTLNAILPTQSAGTTNLVLKSDGANTSWAAPFTLTTTGTSGAATFVAGTLNIPQYQAAGSYLVPADIGVTVQGYSANTTLLGNSVTGSGSIVLATSPTIATSLTLDYATASTVVYLNASKQLISLANGSGVLTNDGAGVLTWAAVSGGAALSAITAATGTNTINNVNYAQVWGWNSLTTEIGLTLSSSSVSTGSIVKIISTSTVGNASKGLEVNISGANSTSAKTNYGVYSSITNTGTTSVNVGGYFAASGGASNYGLQVATGHLIIGAIGSTTYSTNRNIYCDGDIYALNDSGYRFSVDYSGGNTRISASNSDIQLIPSNNKALIINPGTERFRVAATTGNISIGVGASPSAALHIKAGTASAGTAPLKLTAGTNLTTPENGAIEFDGTNIYITVGGVRKTFTIV